jgi:hypothetical protein
MMDTPDFFQHPLRQDVFRNVAVGPFWCRGSNLDSLDRPTVVAAQLPDGFRESPACGDALKLRMRDRSTVEKYCEGFPGEG